jgi:hypothetical protein
VSSQIQFDQLFFNGRILTQVNGARAAEVAVLNGKIVAVGQHGELSSVAASTCRHINLEGATLVPGFEDAHAHIWKIGQLLTTSLDLRRTNSITQIQSHLSERSKILPAGSWLLGRGFNEISLDEKRRPTRADLDAAVPDRPVVLTRTCGHIFVANSRALELAQITRHTIAPEGGLIEHAPDGEPNGLLHETAIGLVNRVQPKPTNAEYKAMLTAALRHQLSLGITASSDCGVHPDLLAVYLAMDNANELPARMLVMPLGKPDGASAPFTPPAKHISPMLRVDTIKFLADGGLSGATAALSVPYRNSNSCGLVRLSRDEMSELFTPLHEAGWRISTHAIGDVTIEDLISAYESLGPHPLSLTHCPLTHRIEHLGLPNPQQLTRIAKLGLHVATQPIFLDELGANFLSAIPDALYPQIYPFRAMINAGIVVAFSSDAPVVENDSPIAGIASAIDRRTRDGIAILPEESITATEALYAYTAAAARCSGEEATRGTITPGRWADFAILSADPTETPIEEMRSIQVRQTWLAGNLVYQN